LSAPKSASVCLLINQLFTDPTPLQDVLLKTKVKPEFDRTVTDRSKPFLSLISTVNRVHFFYLAKFEIYQLINSG